MVITESIINNLANSFCMRFDHYNGQRTISKVHLSTVLSSFIMYLSGRILIKLNTPVIINPQPPLNGGGITVEGHKGLQMRPTDVGAVAVKKKKKALKVKVFFRRKLHSFEFSLLFQIFLNLKKGMTQQLWPIIPAICALNCETSLVLHTKGSSKGFCRCLDCSLTFVEYIVWWANSPRDSWWTANKHWSVCGYKQNLISLFCDDCKIIAK